MLKSYNIKLLKSARHETVRDLPLDIPERKM